MTADRMKMAVARWRTVQGLKSLGVRTGVLDPDRRYGVMRRVDLLAGVRQSLPSLFGSPAASPAALPQNYLPGLNRYLNSLPQATVPANPGGGINGVLTSFQHKRLPFLYRGGANFDPYRGSYFKGVAHATPSLNVASSYADGVFPATSVFRTHPKQRFTPDYGMERGHAGRRLGKPRGRLQKFLRRVLGRELIMPVEMHETLVSPRRNPFVGTYVDRGSEQFVEPSRSVLRQLTEKIHPNAVAARNDTASRSVRETLSQRLPVHRR